MIDNKTTIPQFKGHLKYKKPLFLIERWLKV